MKGKLLSRIASFGVLLCLAANIAFAYEAKEYVSDATSHSLVEIMPFGTPPFPDDVWPE